MDQMDPKIFQPKHTVQNTIDVTRRDGATKAETPNMQHAPKSQSENARDRCASGRGTHQVWFASYPNQEGNEFPVWIISRRNNR